MIKKDILNNKKHVLNWSVANNLITQNTNYKLITDDLIILLKKLRKISEEVLIDIQSFGEISQIIKKRLILV